MSGTATPGIDYVALAGTISLAAGQTTATIDVDPIDDTDIERGEVVILSLSAGTNYELGTPGIATVNIISDEVPPTVIIAANDATATEAGPTSGSFTVTRTAGVLTAMNVLYSVGGTATPAGDYVALSGIVSFANGQSSALISVDPNDDTVIEGDETVEVTLAADAAYDLGTSSAATVTIISDEVPPTVIIAANDATATEAGPTSGSFTITRTSGDTTQPVTVHYTVGGTATQGSDYAALSGSLSLAAAQISATISVVPIDDPDFEPDETVVLTLTADPAYVVGAPSDATVILASDDIQPPTPVVLSVVSVFDEKNAKTFSPADQRVPSLWTT